MLIAIGQIAVAVGAIAGLIVILYKTYWSPKAKARKEAKKAAIKAIDKGDVTGITRFFDRIRKPR